MTHCHFLEGYSGEKAKVVGVRPGREGRSSAGAMTFRLCFFLLPSPPTPTPPLTHFNPSA